MKNQKKAYLYALAAVAFWSSIATAFKLALREVDVIQLLLGATFVSLICLSFILAFTKGFSFLKKLSKKEVLHSALLGLLNPFLYYVVLLKAYFVLPAQEAMALNYIWPISMVLLSVPVLKQKITFRGFIAIIISFAGVLIIATKGKLLSFTFSNGYGDLLAIGSSAIWAFFWIFNVKDKRDEVEKLFLNFSFAFIYVLVAILVFSEIKIPSLNGFLSIVYIGLFEMGITFIFWLKALRYSESTEKVSQLIFLSPFLSLIIISLIVKEPILPATIVGLMFIIGGVIFQQRFSKKKVK